MYFRKVVNVNYKRLNALAESVSYSKAETRLNNVTQYYKGFSVAAASVIPNFVFTLVGYELLARTQFVKNTEGSSSYMMYFVRNFGVSSLVALIASSVTYPFDTLKRLMQVSGSKGYNNEFFSIDHAFDKIKSKGYQHFYKTIKLKG